MHCTKCTSYQSAEGKSALAEDKVQSPVDSSADTKAVMEPAELADPHQSTQVDTADRQWLYLTLEVGRRQLLQWPGKLALALQNLEVPSTTMLFGIPPSSDQLLNTAHCAQLFGTTAWGNIRQKRLRRSRGELFTLFITWQCLCHTGWHCSMLSFCLFQMSATNFAVIFSANCLIYPTAFITCCHPLVTLKSHLCLEEQPRILDPVTILTATNLSFIMPS